MIIWINYLPLSKVKMNFPIFQKFKNHRHQWLFILSIHHNKVKRDKKNLTSNLSARENARMWRNKEWRQVNWYIHLNVWDHNTSSFYIFLVCGISNKKFLLRNKKYRYCTLMNEIFFLMYFFIHNITFKIFPVLNMFFLFSIKLHHQ